MIANDRASDREIPTSIIKVKSSMIKLNDIGKDMLIKNATKTNVLNVYDRK